ncbi:DUF1217 domain-containing protein [Oceaniglobus ichthyenteri]|uniref:DUF1217 domain-containing protein n=1 Tax=Oceaniglobus ichthyenteri TaxID=2136177 RepID=UPI000D3BE3EB|nr:DUF1217 domain-containing protein [Oceaniglobus ichthyenteri]
MSFQPVVPIGGNAGWAFLQRTRESQQEAFNNGPRLNRTVEHFKEHIGKITSAEDLVNDRRLLEVALGAFGLDEDINNKYFIQKILESSSDEPKDLANRLSDKRYLAMAEAFGFGEPFGPRNFDAGFKEKMLTAYKDRQFEIAIGNSAPSMRLALGLERDLGEIASRSLSDNGMWFTVMATKPVRAVFEAALGMPESVGALDLDRQLVEFRDRSERVFGISEFKDFNTPEKIEELTRAFLTRDQAMNGFAGYSAQSAALAILQSGPRF